jgi:hypothetical protein
MMKRISIRKILPSVLCGFMDADGIHQTALRLNSPWKRPTCLGHLFEYNIHP